MNVKGSRTERPAEEALQTKSCRPMTETRAVVLISTSQLLVKLGNAMRTMCGQVMRRNRFQDENPNAMPASVCPRAMAIKAPRKVSVM